MRWTPNKDIALIKLWYSGVTATLIGERLGVTKNAVIGRVHRLRLAKRR